MSAERLAGALACGLALGLAACAASEEDGGSLDGGLDAGTGTDTDTDADTESDPVYAELDGGGECADPVEIPDDPLVWSCASGWSWYPEDTFAGFPGCESADANTVWFVITVPAEHELVFRLNDGPVVWVNVLDGCDATECLWSELASLSSSPAWENDSGADRTVYLAIESNSPILGGGVIDWTFERAEL